MNEAFPAGPLQGRAFDTLAPGDTASLTREVSLDDIALFARVSGDVNPAHLDPAFAAHTPLGRIVAHGMWTAALVSAVLGTRLPGPGTIYLAQDLRFLKPVLPGDRITATVRVQEKRPAKRVVLLETRCTNQAGETVLAGTATVIAPAEALRWTNAPRPAVTLRQHERLGHLTQSALRAPPLRLAVVHPCSGEAVLAAAAVRDAGLADPVLIGPAPKIHAAAAAAGIALDGMRLMHAPHSHAAAARAVALAARGRFDALMRGSLPADELLAAVMAPQSGLRTGRCVSHASVMDVPAYGKLLVITDAVINIHPDLGQKCDICQNAIDLLHILGVAQPRVAVLAAVETVDPRRPATLDAAALAVMASRGQIGGALVDGPLTFGNAVSMEAGRIEAVVSPVAGQADVLLVPDLETGDLLVTQLLAFAGAGAAGLVLGARVPILLTGPAEAQPMRAASVALARLMAARRADAAG